VRCDGRIHIHIHIHIHIRNRNRIRIRIRIRNRNRIGCVDAAHVRPRCVPPQNQTLALTAITNPVP
jgi:hypothetical protein